jgi:cell division protein FtsZ
LGLFEVEAAANRIRAEVDADANIIFGNTILDDMEGRIRVSVVATGIEAAEMRVGKNIEQFPARAKPRPIDMLKAAAATVQKPVAPPPPPPPPPMPQPAVTASANQVHRRIEDLEANLSTAPHSAAEAMILGNNDLPPAEPPQPMPAPRPLAEEIIPVRQEPEKKRRGIFGWGRKEERQVEPAPRVPPQPVQHHQPAPRAVAQAEPIRTAPQPQGTDLFGDQKGNDQFEIPAFLRRQTN